MANELGVEQALCSAPFGVVMNSMPARSRAAQLSLCQRANRESGTLVLSELPSGDESRRSTIRETNITEAYDVLDR
jgi:hypothetical protein